MTYDVWMGDRHQPVPVPISGEEPVVVPNVNGLVYRGSETTHVLLQRRDKPGEVVRGRLELPGGRWPAGERPDVAVAREVAEETGVRVTAVSAAGEVYRPLEQIGLATCRPIAVVTGFAGAYPSLHVLLACQGEGEPRPMAGETADPRWWPVGEVVALLADDPEAFVWQAAAMLRAAGFG